MEKLNTIVNSLKEFADKNKDLTYTMAAIGTAICGYRLGKVIYSCYKYTLRPSKDLKKRYGDGWAIVTGASDGIGKAYAFELARRGFKVGLIARNKEKLDAVAEEIKKTYNTETKCVVFDFNAFYTDEVIAKLKEELEVFDKVWLLVNNVGVGHTGLFHQMLDKDVQALLNVNVYGLVFITKILLPKLLENEKRSGIINIGSGVTRFTYSNFSAYTGTKAFVTQFSQCLSQDYQDKLDIIIATVGPTKTNMNRGIAVFSSTPESCAKHTLDTLGWENHTFGDYKHGIRDYYLQRPVESRLIRFIDKRRYQAAQNN